MGIFLTQERASSQFGWSSFLSVWLFESDKVEVDAEALKLGRDFGSSAMTGALNYGKVR